MASGGYVMEHQATIAMHGIDQLLNRPKAGDDDWHFVFDAQCQICLQTRIALVHDQIDCIGSRLGQGSQARFNFFEPGLETATVALIQRRETTDDPIGATSQYQLRVGDQKHRCRNHRQAQALFKQGRQ
ncbi:hypothetical protein D3C72_2044070 [compost metagenome]